MTASPPSIIGSFSFGGASSSSSSLSPPPSSLSTAKTIGAGNIPPSVVEPKIVTERQWVSIIDQLTGSAEPSARVRSAFFESVGKLLVALGPSTKLKDHIIELLITTVNNAYAKTGYNGGRMSIEDEDDDGGGGGGGRWSGGVPSEVIYHIAFNFPALAAVLSKEGWPRIAPTYQNLVKMDYFDVRKTLASSLHEISAIAGNQEETLCIFLMEPHEIRSAVIAHLGDTLKAFTPVARERCLPIILQVFDLEGKDWRTRQTMAEQLVQVCSLYPTLTVVNKLLPLAVRWAKDSVAGVRKSVAHAFPVIFGQAKNHPDALVTFFERVIGFATADSFRGRLFFIEMCTSLVLREDPDSDPLEFDQFFLPSLAKLANDPVVNVRIALARLVARLMSNKKRRRASVSGKSMRGELLAEMLGTLQKDTDRDVKDLIKNIRHFPTHRALLGDESSMFYQMCKESGEIDALKVVVG
ncbi:hypothetical protein EV182_001345 [Spiromyces aspiralis]|uniref:Uncharacterized protein n=1 Tax=Spiromyces aspiralis TaxID=68401 RepID=A0ACC1HTZ7_9FUNG|nr:hypothetical protein EV182_001345 [Spiromyces aspiralis]